MSKPYTDTIKGKAKHKFNCVHYARNKVPTLPFGLWTIKDKKKICNSVKPRVGSVAIMYVGLPWGHVGVITRVGRRHLTIIESNYRSGKITERHGTTADLMIIGYFKP